VSLEKGRTRRPPPSPCKKTDGISVFIKLEVQKKSMKKKMLAIDIGLEKCQSCNETRAHVATVIVRESYATGASYDDKVLKICHDCAVTQFNAILARLNPQKADRTPAGPPPIDDYSKVDWSKRPRPSAIRPEEVA
jgi:hypothetical protein